MAITYDKLFFQAFNCLPNQSKTLEEYSKDELIKLINILKDGIDSFNKTNNKNEEILHDENKDFGLGIVAENQNDLQIFQEFCTKNFVPISKENCHISSVFNQNMIDVYLSTGINHFRSEYAMFIILKNVQFDELLPLTIQQEFTRNNKLYKYQMQIIIQKNQETNEELLSRICDQLVGEIFFIDHDDHESIPSLPAPKQPQFVSIFPYSQIACWPLPARRDLNKFRKDLGVTHILSLLNSKEINNSEICNLIETHGIISIHLPIQGADLPVFTSSQETVDILIEKLPFIRDLLLNSTETAPVKMIIHCAAGLHRTGTITYLLLRLCGFTRETALLIVNRTRAITARQVGKKRIDAAEYNLMKHIP
ncbi:unnamed protein product [Adineta steineri]|uniref:Tyrosine specific protein phosphatases domain-containing protein n=1 Tax=Adineta steineri TaxID=433720 RepID=A0A814K4B7_9BILA|nr:unnamed protein product [Adineta steineri]CAF3811107.1 unnamed protein product [Adineta steineri]